MKLNLDVAVKGLDGKPIPNSDSIAKLLGNALAGCQSSDPLKVMNIAQNLYNKGAVELDLSDLEMLEKEVKDIKTFTNLLQAQILEIINKTKSQ